MTSPQPYLPRHPEWMLRLQALVDDRLHKRFEFGSHDCSMFACAAVEAVTGTHPAPDLQGTYSTEQEAQAVIDAAGGLHQLADDRLGPRVPIAAANVGDIGLIESPNGPMLAVCMGAHWSAAGAFGLVDFPFDVATVAWRAQRLVEVS